MSAGVISAPHRNRRWLWAAVVGCGVLLLCIARFGMDAGSPWDEPPQAQYGDLVIRWFSSGFHDASATRFENLFLYGGLFEVIAQLVAKISPLGVFETRHLLIACVGLAGIVGAGAMASEVAGPRAGILAGAMLALTPAWIGHAWFNSKDIPFATAATIATWFATRMAVRGVPPRVVDVLGAGIATGAALGIRAGGYFLVAYPLCACLLGITAVIKKRDAQALRRTARITALRFLALIPVAWLLMVAMWPWAWSSPIVAPIVAMKFASRFPFDGTTLFRGELLKPTDVPASYLPTWFAITTPEFYAVAFAMGLVALALRRRTTEPVNARGLAIVVLAVALPITAAVITRPALYDGLRHFLFVFPPLAALAGIAVSGFLAAEAIPWVARASGLGVLVVAAGTTLVDVTRLHPYEYAYFNRSFGGLPAAQGRFETDYWGVAYQEGFEWLVNESHASGNGVMTVSSCNESSNQRLQYYRLEWPSASERFSIVPPEAAPDVFLESTRPYMCSHVDGPVIHTVSRSAVPLLYVRKTGPRP